MASGALGLTPMTEDFSIDQPETHLDDTDERRKKSISKTKQWKDWVEFARSRQDAYRQFMPGVNSALTKTDDNWRVADCIIREIDALINYIEG